MLGWLEWRWLGVFIAPNHQFNRWGRLLSMGAPDSPVRQPRHPTVRVLTVSTVGALTSGHTGQSGVAPDRYCALSGAPLMAALTSARTVLHYSRCRRPLQLTVALASCCYAGAPDSPVNYSRARPQKPEGEEFESIDPGAPDTVRCAQPGFSSISFCSFLLNPNLIFLLVCVKPLAPVECII
jgi:hypothetical protein